MPKLNTKDVCPAVFVIESDLCPIPFFKLLLHGQFESSHSFK